MVGNLGCFITGCNNPVIGQCSGYEGSCGQFYCHTHSIEKLCGECGGRKARDEAIHRTYQDYLETARKIPKEHGTFILFTIVAILIIAAFVVPLNIFTLAAVFTPLTLLAIYLLRRQKTRIAREIADIDKAKPGFGKFYQMYKKEANERRSDLTARVVGEIVGTIAAGAAGGIREGVKAAARPPDYTSAHLTGISNSLDDIKKKLG